MRNTNINWVQMSDTAIIKQLGSFVKNTRIQKNITQSQLAEMAGLNQWTISQIENGESITLSSFIQIIRALDSLFVLNDFDFVEEVSPLEYVKLKKQKKERVRAKNTSKPNTYDLGW